MPNSRACAAFESPSETRRRNSAARVGDNDAFLPVYFPSLFAIAIPSRWRSWIAEYDGSMFELRAVVEPYVSGDVPEHVLIYLPGCERDRRGSVLMELEKAGECNEPQLKRLARNVLRQRYTDGIIDEMLAPERVSYEDIARASSDTASSEPPSILKSIFHDTSGNDGLLGAWLASDERDAEIETKEAARELTKLVLSRLGLQLPEDVALAKLRSITLRYVLASEFRSDPNCAPPAALDSVPTPSTKDEEAAVRELAQKLRANFPEAYTTMADRVEAELGLHSAKVPADALGSVDTFRFEERILLAHCGDLFAAKLFDETTAIISGREHSFWLDRNVARKAQWEACRRMAELGHLCVTVSLGLSKANGDVNAWIEAYTSKGGWFLLDQAQRRLEAWVANLDDDPQSAHLVLFEVPTKTPAAQWLRASRRPWCVPTGPRRPLYIKPTYTAKSSLSSRSPSRTFW
jgi:hypothetical protein